jgi:2',3'-cyclic-nucleotide 2'-phosphodiesterase/3'-nucleotidase
VSGRAHGPLLSPFIETASEEAVTRRTPVRRICLSLFVLLAVVAATALSPGSGETAKKKAPAKRKSSRTATAAPAAPSRVEVAVLHTTDLHGHLLPWDYGTGRPDPSVGLSKLSTLIARVRAEAPQRTILVDAGDCIQGTPLADLHDVGGPSHVPLEKRDVDPQMAIMNALGYDAFAIGNHEYNFGLGVLEKARKEASFPWLSANTLKTDPKGAAAYQAYVVKNVGGVKIGLLGLTTPGVPHWENAENIPGLQFEDPLETARRIVPMMRDPNIEGCDAVIVVAHMGLEEDPGGQPKPAQVEKENRVLAIAREVPGIDAIVMGHTHTKVESRTENGVLLTQAGRWGNALGRIDLTFEKAQGGPGYKLVEKKARLYDVDATVASDPKIEQLAQHAHDETERYLRTELAQVADTLDGRDARLRDNPLLELMTKTMLSAAKADVALSPMLASRAMVPPGPFTVRDAFELVPYENDLVVVEMTGQDVKDALEHGSEYYNGYDFGAGSAPLVNSSIPGYNFEAAEGVTYVMDLARPIGSRVRDLRRHGKPLDPKAKLRVAVNSYQKNGGGNFDTISRAKVLQNDGRSIRDLLIADVRARGRLTAAVDANWRVSPDWLDDPARGPLERAVRLGFVPADSAVAYGPRAPLTRARLDLWTQALGVPQEVPAAEGGKDKPKKQDLTRMAATPATLAYALRRSLAAFDAPGAASTPTADEARARAWGVLDDLPRGADPARLTTAEGAALLGAAVYPRLTFLHTTDLHGALLSSAKDRTTGRPIGGAANLAGWVRAERAKNPAGTIHVDGGDWMQGTPISNLTRGRTVIELMNREGVDAAAIGNHEFDWSVDTLRARMAEAKFQPLGANWFDAATGKRVANVAPWTMVERRGLEVGILGLLTDETPHVTLPKNVAAYRFPDAGVTGAALVDSIKAAGADVFAIVGHLPARQNDDGTITGELADVTKRIPGEIAALGGHSHNRVRGTVDGTPVLISGSHGQMLGRIDLTIDRRTMKPVTAETKSALLTTFADERGVTADAEVAAFAERANKDIVPLMGKVLAENPEALDRTPPGDSPLGRWVSDVTRAAARADVSVQNNGGIRADLDAGPVTVGDVYEIMPFDNLIAWVKLSGAQLLDVIEHGLALERPSTFSGLQLRYDSSRPRGERVVEARLANGESIDPGKEYVLAMTDFLAQGGDGYTMIAKGKDLTITNTLLRDALIDDARRRGSAKLPLVVPPPGRLVDVSAAKRASATRPAG